MTLRRYAALVASVVAVSLSGAFVLVEEGAAFASAAFGALMAAVNTVVAYHLVLWSNARSNIAFLNAILGGMLARMTVMLGAVLVAALFVRAPVLPLAFSLLGHFVLFLGLELTVVHRLTNRTQAHA